MLFLSAFQGIDERSRLVCPAMETTDELPDRFPPFDLIESMRAPRIYGKHLLLLSAFSQLGPCDDGMRYSAFGAIDRMRIISARLYNFLLARGGHRSILHRFVLGA